VAKRWQEKLVARYERNLYVECLGGRKCRGPRTKEQVINAPIQGTAADIVTEGMCAVSERAQLEADIYLNPVINVHDDLTYLFPINETERYMRVAAEEMCKPRFDYINVPLVVEASLGASWHLLEEVKVFRSNEIFNTPSPY
jgi:DNA polymerase-1